jgi:hypothetical protein
LTQFELIFAKSERHGSSFALPHMDIQFLLSNIVEGDYLFSIVFFLGTFVKNQVAVPVWNDVWVFCSIVLCVCFCASTIMFLFIV